MPRDDGKPDFTEIKRFFADDYRTRAKNNEVIGNGRKNKIKT
jgi:hypothetical protein